MKITKFLCAALMLGALASCSDDSDDIKTFGSKSFTDESGLTLTVNGAPMIGKTVAYAPGADASKATLTVTSQFDLSLIPGIEGEGNVLAGPGALPGSKELVLPVTLTDNNGSHAIFSGNSDTQYCTFSYSGEVTDNTLTLSFTDVTLKDTRIAGTWAPVPYSINDDWASDEYGTVYSNPVYYVWESTSDFNFLGTPMPINKILDLVMALPLINDSQYTVPLALNAALQNIDFRTDGNVIAKYIDIAEENATAQTSPANLAQYVLTSDNSMLFFLNPQAIAAHEAQGLKKRATRADIDFSNVLGNVIAQLGGKLGDGVPMRYRLDGNEMSVYLDTNTLLPLMKSISPLLRDEAVVAQLVELVSQQEGMDFIAPMLPSMIASAADVIDNTTKIEIGINLKK